MIKEKATIQLTDDFSMKNLGPVLIYGNKDSGKSKLLNKIAIQLTNKGVKVHYLTRKLINEEQMVKIKITCKDVTDTVQAFQEEMMSRFRLLEEEQENDIFKLNTPLEEKALIIDDLTDYLLDADRKSVEELQKSLGAIVRLGRAVGMYIIVSINKTISSDLQVNFLNKIILGSFDTYRMIQIFDISLDETNSILPEGEYEAPNEIGSYLDLFEAKLVHFNINDIDKYD